MNTTLTQKLAEDRNRISDAKLAAASARHETMMEAGETLRAAREAAGFGVRETAKRLGTSATFICDLEAGRRFPSREMARKLELVLGDGFRLFSSNSVISEIWVRFCRTTGWEKEGRRGASWEGNGWIKALGDRGM